LWLTGITPTVSISFGEVIPDKASLSLTGKVPTLTYSWLVEPVKSDLTLTGYAPVSTSVEEIGEASLTLAGQAPKVKRGPPVIIEVGRYQVSLNGYITTRAYGFLLRGKVPYLETVGIRSPDTVDLTLSTYAPEVDNTTVPPIEIPVPEGQQLGLQGYWPVLGIINPNQESTFIVEGYEPLSWTTSPTFFPDRYSLTIDEKPPVSDVEGLAPEGLLFLNGKTPNVAARTIIPGVGSLTLSSDAPNLTTEAVTLPAASLSLAGTSISLGLTLIPSKNTITVFSQAPIVFEGTNWKIAPAAGSLALSGKTPARNIGFAPLTPVGSLAIAGQDLSIGATVSFEVDTGSAFLSGYAPELFIDLPVLTSKGALTLEGQTFKYKRKRIRKTGARLRLVSLTTEYDIEVLYR
jgi:hypothetical protein